jgi:hypothetical protein
LKRKTQDFHDGENSVELHQRAYFWGHCGWSDENGYPWGINSPRFVQPAELRGWLAEKRKLHAHKDGFKADAYKHTYLIDEHGHGIPGTGKDESLETKEEAVAPPWKGQKLAPLDFIKRID